MKCSQWLQLGQSEPRAWNAGLSLSRKPGLEAEPGLRQKARFLAGDCRTRRPPPQLASCDWLGPLSTSMVKAHSCCGVGRSLLKVNDTIEYNRWSPLHACTCVYMRVHACTGVSKTLIEKVCVASLLPRRDNLSLSSPLGGDFEVCVCERGGFSFIHWLLAVGLCHGWMYKGLHGKGLLPCVNGSRLPHSRNGSLSLFWCEGGAVLSDRVGGGC